MSFKNELNTKEIRYVRANILADEKAIDIESHRINFIVSAEVVDRACEVVEAQAVFDAIHRKSQFTDNPICLPCHMHRVQSGMPPAIGSWDTETAKIAGGKNSKRVEMVLQYDTELQLGAEYWIAYKNRTMRAVSIGFRILDYRVEERDSRRIYIITKLELIEISCVAVGCNQQALAKLKGFDWAGDAESKAITDQIAEKLETLLEPIRDEIAEIKDLLIPDSDVDPSLPDAEEDPSDVDDVKSGHTLLQNLLTKIQAIGD